MSRSGGAALNGKPKVGALSFGEQAAAGLRPVARRILPTDRPFLRDLASEHDGAEPRQTHQASDPA